MEAGSGQGSQRWPASGGHLPHGGDPKTSVTNCYGQIHDTPNVFGGRQALCYQCHAPLASAQAGSGDDRTPMGVHEGIRCLACHQKHSQNTRQSCAECHPRLSNCGLDVEKMDTTFANPKSVHNIHTVKCLDCHRNGVPKKRQLTQASR